MTEHLNRDREALDLLSDALVDDILNTSDEEILAEFQETDGNPDAHAARMRALFEQTILTANKQRLAAAKQGLAASRRANRDYVTPGDSTQARKQLRSISQGPNTSSDLTLAARNESTLTDSDVLSILDDFQELGILPPDSDEPEKL